MPIEYAKLKDQAPKRLNCPKCGSGFTKENAYMRGIVQSGWRKFFGLGYCAVICRDCMTIVDWEKPNHSEDALDMVAAPKDAA